MHLILLFIFQNSKAEISEAHLERLILDAIDHLRKMRKTSNEIAIAKKIIASDKRYSCDMIWAQMGKCIDYGLIEKVIFTSSNIVVSFNFNSTSLK